MIGARLSACLAALGTALALVGCASTAGSPSPSPRTTPRPAAATLTADMVRAVRSASSAHIFGQLIEDGKTIGLDIGVRRSGQLSGTITQQHVTLELVVTGGKAYVKATAAFLRELHAPASVCHVICGKYVELPAAKTEQLTQSLSLASLTHSLTSPPHLSNDGVATVRGQKAYVLRTPEGATVSVAATGSHYPVVVASPGGRRGALNFSQWNSVPVPAAPPKSQIVNIGSLG